MHRDPNNHLEAWADRTLKQLPTRRAPASLAPKVLAAIQRQRALPWYRRPWFTWPKGFQVLSIATLTGLSTGVVWAFSAAQTAAAPVITNVRTEASTAFSIVSALTQAAGLIVNEVPSYIWFTVLGMLAVAWVSFLALGTACWRLVRSTR